MARRSWIAFAGAVGATVLVMGACTPMGPRTLSPALAREDLSSRLPADRVETIEIPYEIDDEIRRFAEQTTRGLRDEGAKVNALVRAIVDRTGLSIGYDPRANKTARQVFREGHGNCMAYANLFVGMAREVGLNAVYVDVVTMQNSVREGDLIVSSGHITAGIQRGDHLTLIDFTDDPERKYRGHKPIDDLTAIAHYYNNEAYLRGFREGSAEAEMQLYRLALAIDPRFYPAHNNLGVALKRQGQLDDAVREYELALGANPHFAEARANLGVALAAQGRRDEAIREFEEAIRDDPVSAQLRHQKGVLLLQARRYWEAEQAFRQALHRDPKFAPAAVFLGESLLAQGKKPEALSAFRRALQIDPANADARRREEELAPKQ